jgi:hypothetical protein
VESVWTRIAAAAATTSLSAHDFLAAECVADDTRRSEVDALLAHERWAKGCFEMRTVVVDSIG